MSFSSVEQPLGVKTGINEIIKGDLSLRLNSLLDHRREPEYPMLGGGAD